MYIVHAIIDKLKNVYIVCTITMSTKANQVVRPKRRIERVNSLMQVSTSTSAAAAALHTAEDSKTLVRIVADLVFFNEAASVTKFACLFTKKPNNTNIYSATLGSSLDGDVDDNYLLPFQAAAYGDSTGTGTPPAIQLMRVHIDTKLMRKLKPGDVIALSHVASTNNGGFFGTINLWFKE